MSFNPSFSLEGLRSLRGWRRLAVAFGLGLLAAAAFPPFEAFPLLWISFPGLFFLLSGAENKKAAFFLGWVFAFGLLVVRLHWIAASLFVDLAAFWWVLPFAVGGLPAFLALYYGVALMVARRGGQGITGVFLFALAWTCADWARAHLLTGMPWDILGYVWADCLPILQVTRVIGINGLTLLTAFFAVVPVFFLLPQEKRGARWGACLFLLFFVGLAFWGFFRLARAPESFVPGVRLRLVQTDQAQALKWRADQRLQNFQKILETSFSDTDSVTHIIWPETAVAYYLTETPDIRARIAEKMPKESILLTGVVRRQEEEGGGLRYFNSLIAMNDDGAVIAGYDKHHLVPFGEYVPLRRWLPFQAIAGLGLNFVPGEGVKSFRAPGLPVAAPLICYEAIFSGDVVAPDDPAKVLLNLTNDAWYEGTLGPGQHFRIARVRAIEEGVPLIRVANKGVTAVVDPWGRVVAQAGEKVGFIDSPLPQALDP